MCFLLNNHIRGDPSCMLWFRRGFHNCSPIFSLEESVKVIFAVLVWRPSGPHGVADLLLNDLPNHHIARADFKISRILTQMVLPRVLRDPVRSDLPLSMRVELEAYCTTIHSPLQQPSNLFVFLSTIWQSQKLPWDSSLWSPYELAGAFDWNREHFAGRIWNELLPFNTKYVDALR